MVFSWDYTYDILKYVCVFQKNDLSNVNIVLNRVQQKESLELRYESKSLYANNPNKTASKY